MMVGARERDNRKRFVPSLLQASTVLMAELDQSNLGTKAQSVLLSRAIINP